MKKVYLTLISSHLCFVNIINRYAFSQQHPTINLQLTTVIAVPIVMLFDLSGSTPLLATQVYLSLLRAGSKGLIIFTVAPLNVATDAVSTTPNHKLTIDNCNRGSNCYALWFVRQHAIASCASVLIVAARWVQRIDHFYSSTFKHRYRCSIWYW